MANCGKVLIAIWFGALALLLASLVAAVFTFSRAPVVTMAVIGGATVVLLLASLFFLCLVSKNAAEESGCMDRRDCAEAYPGVGEVWCEDAACVVDDAVHPYERV